MAYTIKKSNDESIIVDDNSNVVNKCSLTLVGHNVAGYGQHQNTNFVHLLENFAKNESPAYPTQGQLWYDLTDSKVKVYNPLKKWDPLSITYINSGEPTGTYQTGDQLWDTKDNLFKIYSSSKKWVTIGPNGAGSGLSAKNVTDTDGVSHTVLVGSVTTATVGGGVSTQSLVVVSSDSFTPKTGELDASFTKINSGITIAGFDDTTGRSSARKFNGTATDSDRLGGVAADKYVKSPTFKNSTDAVTFKIDTSKSTIDLITVNSGTEKTALTLDGDQVTGTISTAKNLVDTDGRQYPPDVEATATTVVVRTSSDETVGSDTILEGGIKVTTVYCNDTLINGADLAEKYVTDNEYEVGTVVSLGGQNEVTASSFGDRALGVVSGKPGLKMNSSIDGTYIALRGRVPVKVIGIINKGDRLIATSGGYATKATPNDYHNTFAIAISAHTSANVGVVEASIL